MKSFDDHLLRLIAIFKFFKTALLITLGVGAFKLMNQDLGRVIEHWVRSSGVDPGNHFLEVALSKASNLSPAQIKNLGLGSFLYAGLFLAEGIGLWSRKRWGEWLTVIITGSLIPVEIYEIFRRPSALKIAVLVLNLAIVLYLVYRIRKEG
jgi:uncharacterized membrane protein (DUF2068 family)